MLAARTAAHTIGTSAYQRTLLDGRLARQQRRVVVAGAAVVAARCRRRCRRLGGRWRCCGCRRLLLELWLRSRPLLLLHSGRGLCRVHRRGAPLLELGQGHIIGRLRHRSSAPGVLRRAQQSRGLGRSEGRAFRGGRACWTAPITGAGARAAVRWGISDLWQCSAVLRWLANAARGPPPAPLAARQQHSYAHSKHHEHLGRQPRPRRKRQRQNGRQGPRQPFLPAPGGLGAGQQQPGTAQRAPTHQNAAHAVSSTRCCSAAAPLPATARHACRHGLQPGSAAPGRLLGPVTGPPPPPNTRAGTCRPSFHAAQHSL